MKKTILLLSSLITIPTFSANQSNNLDISATVEAGCQMSVKTSVDFGIITEFPPYNDISDWDSFPQDLEWYVQCSPQTVFKVLPFTTETWDGSSHPKIRGIKLVNQTMESYPLSALIMFGVTPDEFVGGTATLHHAKNPYTVITATGKKEKLKAYMFLENIWKVEAYSPSPGRYTGQTTLSIEF